jgi:glycosyltransferase involved in cell wall biosynthesis
VEYLVRAANIVVNLLGHKDVLFLLKGKVFEKEYLERIHKLIEEYKLEENVKTITGFLPFEDVKKLYIASDIYVLPSLEEPCPTSLLEPLACGKPLVGTDVGGIALMIKEGWNGFLVEPANEEQLAEKIRYLIDHPEKWGKMGKNSRKLAEEEFDWRKIAEKYLKVYEEVRG